ncbi:hypothetical protein XENOCAPTIV_010078, partial [Xenoophorus captivus]
LFHITSASVSVCVPSLQQAQARMVHPVRRRRSRTQPPHSARPALPSAGWRLLPALLALTSLSNVHRYRN